MDILIEGLTKAYGPQKAVNDISFEVRTGEIVGFLGPNGAGKTTTMKMITQFIAPDAGQITIGVNLYPPIIFVPRSDTCRKTIPYMRICRSLTTWSFVASFRALPDNIFSKECAR